MTTAAELNRYSYTLPERLIAQHPLPRRTDARLMLVDRQRQTIEHYQVHHLPELLRAGDCVVLNNTRVIAARLVGYRTLTGGRWEGLYLESDSVGLWRLLARCRGKPAAGETITLLSAQARDDVRLRLVAKQPDGSWIAMAESDEPPLAILDRVGRVPLPRYIRAGEMHPADRQRYQTVFAKQPGAVAAPTAGLHFSDDLLQRLREAGIATAELTLHVGLGTFRPIDTPRLEDFRMHAEWGELGTEAAERLVRTRRDGGRIVAVGTTCVRTLETAARHASAGSVVAPWQGTTDLFIRPPYEFRAVDALLTNFHLPRTTLLVLVSTFGGDELIRRAYRTAVQEEYRFYSYGDAMLIV